MEHLLTFSFYFTPRPDPDFQHTKIVAAVVLVLFISSLILRIWRKRYLKDEIKKKLLRRYPGMLQNYATFLLLILVFRETGVPYLSMRIWGILWLGLFLYHFCRFLIRFNSEYRRRSQAFKSNGVYQYLPRKK